MRNDCKILQPLEVRTKPFQPKDEVKVEVRNVAEEVDLMEVVNIEGEDPKNLVEEPMVIKVVTE